MPSSRGILFKVIALFLFSIMASLVKASAPHVPSYQAVFFRSFFAMPIILIWLAQRHDLRTGLKTQNPFGHLWRGLIGTSAMVMGFSALGILPLPEVTAIGFAAPLFTVILAALLLGETIRIFRLTALAIGLIGVAINDAIVVLAALRENESSKVGNPEAVRDVVIRSTRHIVATSLTTMAGFAPLVLSGGGFWPPMAVAIAGGVGGLGGDPSLEEKLHSLPRRSV